MYKEHSVLTYILGALTLFVLVSCLGVTPATPSGGGTGSGGSSTLPTATPTTAGGSVGNPSFSLSIQTAWDGNGTQTGAEADAFTQTCVGQPPGPSQTCTVTVPEAQMHLSDFNMTLSSAPGTCDLIRFYPYFYRASNTSGFVPEWDTAPGTPVDCTTNSASCYSGPAVELVSNFPIDTFIDYFPGLENFSQSWTAHSGLFMNRSSNRWMSNDLVNQAAAVTGLTGDGYVANSMRNWRWSCQNTAGTELYGIRATFVPATTVTYQDWSAVTQAPTPAAAPFSLTINAFAESDTALANPIYPAQSCVATSGTPQKTCSINFPQALLYMSQFQFSVSAPAATCQFVHANPYYYQASSSATFQPEWNNYGSVDCSGGSSNLCFSGPAEEFITGAGQSFPGVKSLFYAPNQGNFSQSWVAHSAQSRSRSTNRYMSNDFVSGYRGLNIVTLPGDGYVANSMVDWSFTCTDSSDNLLYSVGVTITPTGTTPLTYPGWEALPAPPTSFPMTLNVASYWEEDTQMLNPTLQHICNIPAATSPGSGAAYNLCQIIVPESMLYFSQLQFTLSAPAATCDVAYYAPYFYLASTSHNFTPEWSPTKVDCNPPTGGTPAICYSGPGIDIPSFPAKASIVIQPAQAAFTNSWSVRSAHVANRLSNRWASNSPLPPAPPAVSVPPWSAGSPDQGLITEDRGLGQDGYVSLAGSTEPHYFFTCADKNSSVNYQFEVDIISDSSAGSAVGAPRFYDWNGVSGSGVSYSAAAP